MIPDVVWPEHKQIGVIDSIIRNFYLPPVIFCKQQQTFYLLSIVCSLLKINSAVNNFEDGSETRTCIDGKQRLTSIYRCVCCLDIFSRALKMSNGWNDQIYGWTSA